MSELPQTFGSVDQDSSRPVYSAPQRYSGDRYQNYYTNVDYYVKPDPDSPMASTASSHTPTLSVDSTIASSVSSEDLRQHKRQRSVNSAASGSISGTGGIASSVGSPAAKVGPNDRRLVQLAEQEWNSTFEELANSVRVADRLVRIKQQEKDPQDVKPKDVKQAESDKKRSHQVFALVMLMRFVQPKDNAVCPRNHIYNRYAAICRENGIQPMCNASFGKLVRLLFPHVKARRLGIRGSSRYHYCGIKLLGDSKELDFVSPGNSQSASTTPQSASLTATPSASIPITTVPSQDTLQGLQQGVQQGFQQGIQQGLQDAPLQDAECALSFEIPVQIPQFSPSPESYLRGDVDPMFRLFAAEYVALSASVFQNLRFMKVKTLFDEMTQFQIPPEIFTYVEQHPIEVSNFVRKCDMELYQSCATLLSKVAFQNVPESVRVQINNLESHLLTSSQCMQLPEFIKDTRFETMDKFVEFLHGISRVTSRAAALAQDMTDPQVRRHLLHDWTSKVDIEQLVQHDILLPRACKPTLTRILKNDITALLSDFEAIDTGDIMAGSTVIQTWSALLATIPQRVPQLTPREFLLCSNSLLSAIMRQTADSGSAGLSVWWKINCWMTEFFNLMAALGGFLRQS